MTPDVLLSVIALWLGMLSGLQFAIFLRLGRLSDAAELAATAVLDRLIKERREEASHGEALARAVAENTALTKQAAVAAGDAYKEANHVNEKIAMLREDVRAVVQRKEP